MKRVWSAKVPIGGKETLPTLALRGADHSSAGWPVKPLIASVMVAAMLLVASVIIYVGWRGAREALLHSAAEAATEAGKLVTEQANRKIDPIRANLRLLASSPLAGAQPSVTLSPELRHLDVRMMAAALQSSSLVSAVFVGFDDGAFLLLRPISSAAAAQRFEAPATSQYLLQSIEAKSDGTTVGEFHFFDTELKLLERRTKPDYNFDPRSRPWFQAASITARTYASAPYLFFTTQQVGITLSHASGSGSAVVGMDVVLDDLAVSMRTLKMTPNTELALIDLGGKVVVYPDMARVFKAANNLPQFKHVRDLAVPSLARLHTLAPPNSHVARFELEGREWLGAALPFDAWQADGVRLMVAAPSDDFLTGLNDTFKRLLLWMVGLTLLLAPVGWLAGAAIGRSLDKLTAKAHRMNRFDFSEPRAAGTLVREVNTLSDVVGDMGKTIATFLQISHDMANEPDVHRMLETVLRQLVTATRCSSGAVYLCDAGEPVMRRAAYRGDFVAMSEPHTEAAFNPSTPMVQRSLTENLSELQVELRGRNGSLQGLLLLQYPPDADHGETAFTEFVQKLSGILAVTIETRQISSFSESNAQV